jgi:UDP-2,3-diacylglucosamine pyrophosphatase LpxH
MRTAIVSDLHLGAASGEDVLRDAAVRRLLIEGIADADRVVLLGDVVELRDLPVGAALAAARPFFEELGAALGEREAILVPGNHDHRLAEPLLDGLSLSANLGGASRAPARPPLGLEQLADPSPGPTALIAGWLAPARLRIAYPGLWLREDVYATHGHYMDAHLTLPRAECVAAATLIRFAGPPPDPATPADYERVLRPIYGFSYGVAQARRAPLARRRTAPSEAAWELLSGRNRRGTRRRRLAIAAARRGFPAGIWALNRLLRSNFEADISTAAIFSGGVEAAAEMAARLGVDGGHVITGHTHRGGPLEDEAAWPLPGGGQLHNSGSWVFASAFHHAGTPPGPYWPGTVTWVEDGGPPRRVRLLMEHSHERMSELISPATRR